MRHPGKQLLFLLLGLADLALTGLLQAGPTEAVYEANPLAHGLLNCTGWLGLAGFKTVMLALVLCLAVLIARSRPRVAGRVLSIGCGATGAVVLYSAALALGAIPTLDPLEADLMRQIDREREQTNRKLVETYRRSREIKRLGAELAAEQCTLLEAAERLVRSAMERDPSWRLGALTQYPHRSLTEVAAIILIRFALSSLTDPTPEDRVVFRRLEREFRRIFGRSSPVIVNGESLGPECR
jgi:hypothetical protein